MTENEVIEQVEQTEEVQQQEMTPEEQKAIWQQAKQNAKKILAEAYAKERGN